MSTLTVMQGLLRERIGNPTTTDVPDATLTKRLNEALEFIWTRYRFHANRSISSTITTVAGTSGYTLPVACDILRTVRDGTNFRKLEKMGEITWDSISAAKAAESTPTRGKPTRYFRANLTLFLDPVPDGAYVIQVRFRSSFTAMSSGSDVPTIPTSWHFGIVLYARFLHWETVQDATRAIGAFSVFNAWVKEQPSEFDEEIFADASYNLQPEGLSNPVSRFDFDHSDW